jgi:glycyl-tRNA synthetase
LEYAYKRVKDRTVLTIPIDLAPLQLTVFPLMAKDGLPELGREITDFLAKQCFDVEYDDAGTIGKRYARADEIGVPISITADYQTKKDGTVTLRDRDTWQQVRNDWKSIPELMRSFFKGGTSFSALGAPVEVAYE